MLKSDLPKWIVLMAIPLFFSCTAGCFPNLVIAEKGMVASCRYLDTISEISDLAKAIVNYKYYHYYDGELKVLQRADHMGATHLVWLYNYAASSSGSAYRCDEEASKQN